MFYKQAYKQQRNIIMIDDQFEQNLYNQRKK